MKFFSFREFRKGLEWFSQAQCRGCLAGDGAHCENRGYASRKGRRSCLPCESYLECPKTAYQREWYPFVAENHERVKQVGFDRYLLEEEERARAGADLMGHLEKRCCKVVESEGQ